MFMVIPLGCSRNFDHSDGVATELLCLLCSDTEVLEQCFHVDGAFAVLDGDANTVLLTTVLAFAKGVSNVVFEFFDLSSQSFLLTIQHGELVDGVE